MGTSGLRIIKFRGRYWVFHNYYHSYLEGMGDSLVHSIPSDPERYQQWLQSQRCLYAKWDDLLQRILCIEPDHLLKIESDTTLVGFLAEAFDERLSVIPSYVAESLSWNWPVAFTYTLDLDLEVFTIDNTAHYRLDKVPKSKDWIRALCVDDNRRRFIHPRLAPEESLASLVVKNAEFHLTDKEYWESLTSKLVKPKSARSTSAMVRLSLFRIFAECQFDTLSVSLLSWTTKDLPFREIVFFIICLATGGSHLALVDERQFVYSRSAAPSFAALLSIDGEKELISPLGVGFHMHNQPIGSAPDASKYWFEGALVCLVPQLEDPDVALKAMGDAIRYGRGECKRTSFNAVLISIAHVIFLRSLPDGGIEYSHSMSLMNTDDFFGMSARERYQEGWLDEVYE
ncbi:MAG: hypothetical protein LQ338_008037, partial [Usnochroma carphineum]